MPEPKKPTPITLESLAAIGGVIEEPWRVRFGEHTAVLERGFWQIGLDSVRSVEAIQDHLKRHGWTKDGE